MSATILAAIGLTSAPGLAQTNQPSIEATLSPAATSVDRPVQLSITVTGGAADAVPVIPHVDGLEIVNAGQGMRTEVQNFNISTKVTYSYIVTPKKEGNYEIPGIDVQIGGRNLRTSPLQLQVGTAAAVGATGKDQTAWGEVRLGRTEAYVGESLPVEFRFSFDSRVRVGIDSLAQFESDGFTFEKLREPQQEENIIDGRPVTTIVYRTTIVPAKTGELKIGPIEQAARLQVQQQRTRRSPRTLDPFDPAFDDFFNSIFDDPRLGIPIMQRVTITAPAVTLTVKPVPRTGAPESFAGAVGQFEIKTAAEPLRLKLGEPLTLTLEITGSGSFEGFEKPHLSNAEGWKDYPPTSRFQSDGPTPNSGTKRIELVLAPTANVRNLPVAEFSYFDPRTGEFKVLKSEPLPVEILDALPQSQATAPPQPTTSPGPATAPSQRSPSPGEAPARFEEPKDINYLTVEEPVFTKLPQPLERSRGYLITNAAIASLLVVGLGVAWLRNQPVSSATLKKRQLREYSNALNKLASQTPDAREFYELAASLVRKLNRSALSPQTAEACTQIVSRRDELFFSGSREATVAISDDEQQAVIRALNAAGSEALS